MVDYQAVKDAAETALLAMATEQRPGSLSVDGDSITFQTVGDLERIIALCDRKLAEADRAAGGGGPSYVDT